MEELEQAVDYFVIGLAHNKEVLLIVDNLFGLFVVLVLLVIICTCLLVEMLDRIDLSDKSLEERANPCMNPYLTVEQIIQLLRLLLLEVVDELLLLVLKD